MTGNPGLILIIALILLLAADFVLRRRQFRKLQEAQEFLHLAKQETLEAAQLSLSNPYPLIQISKEGNVIFMNPAAFEKYPGIKEKGLQHPVLTGLEDVIGKNETASREIKFGRHVYYQTVAPTQVNGEQAFIIYCFDITPRKRFEKKLKESRIIAEQARREAERANQARGDFLANMSHELRTPMNGIIGLSDILMEAGLKKEHQELIEAVNSSAHNLLILLNDILDFSKIEAGELTLEAIPFDPRRIIKQIESLQKPVAAGKGLEMKSVVDENVPPYLIGDPSRLQQILNNLISNALKFTEEGSVTLSVDGKGDSKGNFITRIAVTDTGIGIPKDKQSKIFEKFQQADASTSRKYGGTGLGLAITRHLAKLMGGDIFLKSAEGKGTTFTVTIPAKIAEAATIEEGRKDETVSGGINMQAKIMVVDDHPVNLLFMRQTLTKLGFKNFDEANSGRQAIELFENAPYELIFMDCKMPEMDGYEASQKIRKLEAAEHKPVIIAVTADAMKSAEEKCIAAGMDDYISKPVDKKELQRKLQRWLPGDNDIKADTKMKTVNGAHENTKTFDWNHLYEFTDGDKEIEKMLIDMFLENLQLDLKKLQKSFSDDNFDEWESMAHKLHGASAHMGAYALADICDQAQSLSSEETEKMKDLHQLIISESRRLHGLLEKNRQAA